MKMVKKSLLGLVAVAALVLSLVGCGPKDDTEGIIKGTLGNYTVNYTYNNADPNTEYRAYRGTGARHSGALVKVTFNADDIDKAGNSKFGLIFGLKETKQGGTNFRNFYIVGLGANGHYYVSKYENIVDIQAKNFGASTNATGTNPKETIITTEGDSNGIVTNGGNLYEDDDGNKYAYIWYQVFKDGSIHVAIGDMEDSAVTEWKNKTDTSMTDQTPTFKGSTKYTTIISSVYSSWSTATEAPQDYAAVYTRVQGGSTLNGKVKFQKDFHEADDIEQID